MLCMTSMQFLFVSVCHKYWPSYPDVSDDSLCAGMPYHWRTSGAVDIAERVSLISADAITVAVTVYHTYGAIKTSREIGIQAALSSALLRAGLAPHSSVIAFDAHIFLC